MRQYWIFLLVLIFPLFIHIVSTHWLDPIFFWGSSEKHHGYFFYVWILIFAGIASLLTKKEFERAIFFSLGSAFLVAIFAIIEYFGISLFFPSTSTVSWELGRTISTLGNPNYVAGYLLLHFPLVQRIRKPERYIVLIVLLLGIITTGSVIGITFLAGYCLYTLLRKIPYGMQIWLAIVVVGIIGILTLVPHDKLLSLESRWVLMIETLKLSTEHISWFLFGNGPDSLILAYSHGRSEKIESYFPDAMSIDSAHNIIIDILYSYGLIFLILLVFLIIRQWRYIESMARLSLILSILFFSLNVIVLPPLLIMILLMSYSPPAPDS